MTELTHRITTTTAAGRCDAQILRHLITPNSFYLDLRYRRAKQVALVPLAIAILQSSDLRLQHEGLELVHSLLQNDELQVRRQCCAPVIEPTDGCATHAGRDVDEWMRGSLFSLGSARPWRTGPRLQHLLSSRTSLWLWRHMNHPSRREQWMLGLLTPSLCASLHQLRQAVRSRAALARVRDVRALAVTVCARSAVAQHAHALNAVDHVDARTCCSYSLSLVLTHSLTHTYLTMARL